MSYDREEIRLAKVLAARGLASRREAERMIEEGRIVVNGEVVSSPATFVDPSEDHIRVDGQPLPEVPPNVYYILYKPRGYITSRHDPEGRKSVLELAEELPFRVEPVGRLDFDTEGALILTNDGDLAHKLMHPSTMVPRRYRAKVYRTPNEADIKAIEQGVYLEDGRTTPAKARVVERTDSTNAWVEVTVTEGRNRLIRRMFAQLGHPVAKLRRESFGSITIRGMERGQVRQLTSDEVQRLREVAEGRNPRAAAPKSRKGFAKAKPKKQRLGAKARATRNRKQRQQRS
ncbi:MAG: rRNA pseudouridine synthase [Deltaproteobacteria bacterium]|nr:MAG: rRNA pseudouridine synthase [Deltaproteobacteria bacterium]